MTDALAQILAGLNGPQLALLVGLCLALVLAGVGIGWALFHVPRPRGLYIHPRRRF